MVKKVKKTIEKYNLLEKGDSVVVALSGGPDSTALFAILSQIAKEMNLNLIIAHFNHGLRGKESDDDEEYSRDLSEKKGFVFVSGKMNLKKRGKGISPEDFCRRERYEFLNKVAEDYQAKKIALGHNMHDQAETVLLNILRGSGLEGLKGFLPIRDGKFIRPLIEISRQEIVAFLKREGIWYREDISNENRKYLRNQIRHELIPYLKENFNPKIENNLTRMAEILRTEDEFIKQSVANALESLSIQRSLDCILLKTNDINKLHSAIRLRVYKSLLEGFNPAKNGISFSHIKALDNLVQKSESGKRLVLPWGIEAKCEYGNLILRSRDAIAKQILYEYRINVPGTFYIKERKLNVHLEVIKKEDSIKTRKNEIYLDFDKIQQPLIIRNRRDGDWFQPLGMSGRQKIKTFFINRKVPRLRRNEIMLLVDNFSVIWIENMHINDRVKITSNTKNVLKLSIIGS